MNRLLATPGLPTIIPLASLTHLSTHLPIFTLLLPYAAHHPHILDVGDLNTEQGKTYCLANLATFGITGGMLARYGRPAAIAWIHVLKQLLGGVGPGWGLWAEGVYEAKEVDVPVSAGRGDDSDDEDIEMAPVGLAAPPLTGTVPPLAMSMPKRPRQNRPLLPINISSKLLLLAMPSHMLTLTTTLTASASSSTLIDFCAFALSLLYAFRGTPKWEGTLDALLAGQAGRQLMKRIWREGVRGRWSDSRNRASWDMFGQSESVLNSIRRPLTRRPAYTHPTSHHADVQPLFVAYARRRVLCARHQPFLSRRSDGIIHHLARSGVLGIYERGG
jgi:ubiquitin-protein ligase E3 C